MYPLRDYGFEDHSLQLSPNPFPECESRLHVAYQQCIALETGAPNLETVPGCPPPLICARLLGHLLRLAPDGNGRNQVQQEITSALDNNTLMEVAGRYFNGFILAFKHDRTPQPSEGLVWSEDDEYTKKLLEEMEDYQKARNMVFLRDNYSCVITGQHALGHGGPAFLEAVHIIPESLNARNQEGNEKHAAMWTILSMFTNSTVALELVGNDIHQPENILSMDVYFHALFNDLIMWLKPVQDTPHTYQVHFGLEICREHENIPEFVTFTTDTNLSLPNSVYLTLHAICCELVWMSGAWEYILDLENRMEATCK